MRRFESEAPGELGGQCVDLPGTDDATGSNGSGSESGDTDTVPECAAFDMLRVGRQHTCARDLDGALWCWGMNTLGQQGAPRTDFITEPERVEDIGAVTQFDTSDHTCVVDVEGVLSCFGSNSAGQVDPDQPMLPVIEDPYPIPNVPGVVSSVTTGTSSTCASVDSELYCWGRLLGSDFVSALPIPGVDEPLVSMVGGRAHACGLTEDGRTFCWGDDSLGQLGDGGGTGNGEAVEVEFIEDNGVVHSLAAGDDHTCAVFEGEDGLQVRCWGSNEDNQTGLLLASPIPFPHTPVGDLLGGEYGPLGAGRDHSCVWAGVEGLFCWGANPLGQGNWDTSVDWLEGPNAVALPFGETPEPVALSGGNNHTCVLRSDGSIDCWGCNERGQLGAEPRGCDPDDVLTVRVCAVPGQ